MVKQKDYEKYITEKEEKFLERPSISITYGINNKVDYFDVDKVMDLIVRVKKDAEKRVNKAVEDAKKENKKKGVLRNPYFDGE